MVRFFSVFILSFLLTGLTLQSRAQTPVQPHYGPHDTLMVAAIYYDNEWMPYSEMEMVYVSNVPADKLAKILEAYNRLRNAVYVTYPYARAAGAVINDVNGHLQGVTSKSQRKDYIKTREAELKKEFSDPLSN